MPWNRMLLHTHFLEREKAIAWCQQNGLLPSEMRCPSHGQILKLNTSRPGFGSSKCRKSGCRNREFFLAPGTWFEGSRLSVDQEMSLMYSYAHDDSYEDALREVARPKNASSGPPSHRETMATMSRSTVADRYAAFRRLIMEDFLERQEGRGKIGGPGTIVQLDESKFGRRKYNRGRHTDGHWVLGMIQNGSEDLRLVLCPHNKRGETELLPIIQRHIAPGTEIHTDCWKAYDGLAALGYVHKRVNHSDADSPFVAEDGTHTNRIESQWRPGKDHFRQIHIQSVCAECNEKLKTARVEDPTPEQKKTMRAAMRRVHRERDNCASCQELEERFAEKLVEYQWRREMRRLKEDPFEHVLGAIRRAFPL